MRHTKVQALTTTYRILQRIRNSFLLTLLWVRTFLELLVQRRGLCSRRPHGCATSVAILDGSTFVGCQFSILGVPRINQRRARWCIRRTW